MSRDLNEMWDRVKARILNAKKDGDRISFTYQDSDSEYTEIEELLDSLKGNYRIEKEEWSGIQIQGIRTSVTYYVKISKK